MLASIKSVQRWVQRELTEMGVTVFHQPPKTMEEFNKRQGRYELLIELQNLLTENEDAEESR